MLQHAPTYYMLNYVIVLHDDIPNALVNKRAVEGMIIIKYT